MTYWPAPSRGNLWLGRATATPFVSLIGLLPIGAGLIVLPYVFWFSSLRYELGDGELVLRCGPYRYRVRLADITSIDRRDLAFTFLSGMRLPGFALGEIHARPQGRHHRGNAPQEVRAHSGRRGRLPGGPQAPARPV